jgi:cell division septation protein DedD
MRTLALFLILANTVFFTWQLGLLSWFPWPPDQFLNNLSYSHQTPSRQEVSQLLLLNERNALPQNENQVDKKLINTSPVFSPNGNFSSPESHSPPEDLSNPLVAKPTASKLQQVAGGPLTPQLEAAKNSQNDENLNPSTNGPTSLQAQSLPVSCYQAGPFTKQATVEKMVRWLNQKKNVTANQEVQKSKKIDLTWVYLPPFESRAEARRIKQRLRNQGIKDYLIISQGQLNNGISLGRFRESSNVEARIKDLKAKGYQNVKTQKYYKNETEYWLNVKMPEDQKMLKAFSQNFQEVQLVTVTCKSIAKKLENP